MGENVYMLPSDMNLKIKTGTILYNNKILISDGKFNLAKNDKVDAVKPANHASAKVSHNVVTSTNHNVVTATHNVVVQKPTTHQEEKMALMLFLAGTNMVHISIHGSCFQSKNTPPW